jgi:tetratricopeptide (TPR) repeat protein
MQVRARAAPADATCWVCLEPAGERRTRSRRCELQRGCSCRGSAGWAHFPCLLRVTDQQEALGKDGASCPMCKQQYTGELELALGRAKFERLKDRPADCPERTAAQFYLAETIRFNVGAVDAAKVIYEEILAVYRRTLGADHPNTLCVLDSLGELFLVQGQHVKALPLLEEALERGRVVLGPEDRHTLCSLSSLGRLHQNRGDYDRALPLLEFDLAASRRTLGNAHHDTLVSLANLGLCHMLRGEHDTALALMVEDMEVSRRLLGLRHPHTLVSMCNLGGLHTHMGNYEAAEAMLDEVAECNSSSENPGGGSDRGEDGGDDGAPPRPRELAVSSALALLYTAKGEHERALPLLEKCYAGRQRALGVEHPTTFTTAGHLGTLLIHMNDADGARALLEQATAGLRKVGLMESHFWLAKFSKTLATELPTVEEEEEEEHKAASSASQRAARKRKRR